MEVDSLLFRFLACRINIYIPLEYITGIILALDSTTSRADDLSKTLFITCYMLYVCNERLGETEARK